MYVCIYIYIIYIYIMYIYMYMLYCKSAFALILAHPLRGWYLCQLLLFCLGPGMPPRARGQHSHGTRGEIARLQVGVPPAHQ